MYSRIKPYLSKLNKTDYIWITLAIAILFVNTKTAIYFIVGTILVFSLYDIGKIIQASRYKGTEYAKEQLQKGDLGAGTVLLVFYSVGYIYYFIVSPSPKFTNIYISILELFSLIVVSSIIGALLLTFLIAIPEKKNLVKEST